MSRISRLDRQTNQVPIYPVETFRQVIEVNLVAPVYWALEMVAGIAEDRARRGAKRWEPAGPLQAVVVFIGSVPLLGNKGQIALQVRACLKNPTEIHSLRFGVPPLGGSGVVPPKGGTPNAIFRHALSWSAV